MKKLELVQLRLKNFKGIKEFILNAEGNNVSIFGDNEKGKTTLFDAFTWLLFDKDSTNKKEFGIKTVDEDNNVIHGLDHEVELVLKVDGESIILKKIYKEVWTKPRGKAHREFTSHTTDHFIDEVPVKPTEYKNKISSLVGDMELKEAEKIFKLLTSPSFFNESFDWKERREEIIKICGDVSNEDVIASDKKLSKLTDILGSKSIDDLKKIVASKKKKINDELNGMKVRIDEVTHNLPDIKGLKESDLDKKMSVIELDIEEKEGEINRIRNGAEVVEKQKELSQLQSDLIKIKTEHDSENRDKVNEKETEFNKVRNLRDDVEFQITSADRKIKMNTSTAKELETKKSGLAEQYYEEQAKELEAHDKDECSACGQSLPEDQVKEAHAKALASFNLKKSERTEHIMAQGKQLKDKITSYDEDSEKLLSSIRDNQQKLEDYDKQLEALQSEIKEIKTNTTSITDNAKYKQIQTEIQSVEKVIEELKSSGNEKFIQAKGELAEIKDKKQVVEQDVAKIKQHESSKKRIKELTEQERKLAMEYEKLEEELYLSEEFTRQKVSLLEGKINSKFKYARFKLFETQINDGLKETCEVLYKGVPYSKGLNNAARINVGLDIINTLSEHYNFSAPIFIDNREAVTKLIDTEAQTINLVVSEKDKELRVEQTKEMELV